MRSISCSTEPCAGRSSWPAPLIATNCTTSCTSFTRPWERIPRSPLAPWLQFGRLSGSRVLAKRSDSLSARTGRLSAHLACLLNDAAHESNNKRLVWGCARNESGGTIRLPVVRPQQKFRTAEVSSEFPRVIHGLASTKTVRQACPLGRQGFGAVRQVFGADRQGCDEGRQGLPMLREAPRCGWQRCAGRWTGHGESQPVLRLSCLSVGIPV